MKDEKIKNATFNNRKRQLTVRYTSGKTIQVHYGALGITQNIEATSIELQTGRRSIRILLKGGRKEYVPYDQPLAIAKDSDFLLRNQIEILIAQIKQALNIRKISKKYLAEVLNTSESQVHRLLNPSQVNKNLEQIYKVAHLLNLNIQLSLKKAA